MVEPDSEMLLRAIMLLGIEIGQGRDSKSSLRPVLTLA